MKTIFLIITLLFSISNYSQFGVTKDINIAKNEIKKILKNNNFNLIKEKKEFRSETNSVYLLFYKEEFHVNLNYNAYQNCFLIQFIIDSKNKEKLYEKLLTTFNFSKWEYKSNDNSWVRKLNTYEYKNISIETKEYKNPKEINYSITFDEK
ncbi:hypothetical protein ACFX5E_04715 [Flavobacterium sp. LS2P90]|uniref:Uncharacterized protein n=1 Tax=Flavobacterium xylosi TaxID=3230415 RepID=A0ABW6HTQ0_9FLAO